MFLMTLAIVMRLLGANPTRMFAVLWALSALADLATVVIIITLLLTL